MVSASFGAPRGQYWLLLIQSVPQRFVFLSYPISPIIFIIIYFVINVVVAGDFVVAKTVSKQAESVEDAGYTLDVNRG